MRDVVERYDGRSWSANFGRCEVDGDRILKEVRNQQGSLSASARALGLPLAELRRRIEWWGLAPGINRIRKRAGRRPAKFRDETTLPMNVCIYEERVTV